MYKSIIKPFLFSKTPEKAHYFVFDKLKFWGKIPGFLSVLSAIYKPKNDAVEVFGLNFPNRVGLAAGFDKDAKLYNELSYLGFGFIEIGTVTPKGQPGNPQPRLFRLPKDEALINRMGFNNDGVEAAVERLKGRNPNIIIGGNIGKNKVTPNEEATDDYVKCFNALYDYVDYFAVNVSSPNTPNLRELQDKEPLTKLLSTLMDLNKSKSKSKPLLLKIAPDVTESQLDDIVDITKEVGLSGLIVSNTTISRSDLKSTDSEVEAIGAGGLSGKPVRVRSTQVIKYLFDKLGDEYPIIGVGGIHSAKDAQEKLDAGAKLVQIYTGFIYEGPGLIKRIVKGIKS